jgi:tRNA pseudouridine38-40 synthase
MPRYALELEYDGAAFAGTQVQAQGERTLQAVLDQAVATLDGAALGVRMGSRLDAEVSAEALGADALFARAWDPLALGFALSQALPADVVVRRVAAVDDQWSAKHQANAKTYRYRIRVRGVRPVLDLRSWWLRRVDFPERLDQLAPLLVGDRDLAGFASLRHDDSDEEDPRRRILSAGWERTDDGLDRLLTFRITGEGFLYKQVRGLVGAMLAVAQGRFAVADFAAAVAAGRGARRLGNVAPGHALVLERVGYEREPAWVRMESPAAQLDEDAAGRR